MYTSKKITGFADQHHKLKKAIAHQKLITIKLDLDHSDVVGGSGVGDEHTLLLTRSQS